MSDLHRCPHHPDERRTYQCGSCDRCFCDRCREGIDEGEPRCPDCDIAAAILLADVANWTDRPDLL